MKKSFLLLFCILLAGFSFGLAGQSAQKVSPQIIAYVEKSSAIYKVGEKIRFKIWYVQPPASRSTDFPVRQCKIIPGKKIDFLITGDGGLCKKGSITSGTEAVILETSLDRPGFVLLTLKTKENNKVITRLAGAGVEPEKIRAGTVMPADFETYWKGEIAKMRARKATITMREATEYVTNENKHLVKLYDVAISDGVLTARGILTVPLYVKEKGHPVMITFGGASSIGAAPHNISITEAVYRNMITFVMNIHDTKNYVPTGAEKNNIRKRLDIRNYHRDFLDDREKFALHNIYLRIVRSLDFLKSLPEWNGKDLIASGPSFGGCQTIVAAALDKDVSLALAGGPACCDHEGKVNNQTPGYPNLLAYFDNTKRFSAKVREKARENARYFDAANMAKLIKCPVVFSVGFIDTVCPPVSVYSAYNNLSVKDKRMIHGVYSGHGNSLVAGDKGAFSACYDLRYREMIAGDECLANGNFRYLVPKKGSNELYPYGWLVKGKGVKAISDGKKGYACISNGSMLYQSVYNLKKLRAKVTVQGKFRGKGVSNFFLNGAIPPKMRIFKPVSAEKWQDFSFIFDVKDGSYIYSANFIAGKDALLEVAEISVKINY
ncbi:MAG: acetylxylan esterase [Lentisphaeria bacterium]|nr:acetylxylan esterase [Lentisphaeria bacterium]